MKKVAYMPPGNMYGRLAVLPQIDTISNTIEVRRHDENASSGGEPSLGFIRRVALLPLAVEIAIAEHHRPPRAPKVSASK